MAKQKKVKAAEAQVFRAQVVEVQEMLEEKRVLQRIEARRAAKSVEWQQQLEAVMQLHVPATAPASTENASGDKCLRDNAGEEASAIALSMALYACR